MATTTNSKPIRSFRLGQVVATPGVLAAMERTGENPATFLDRHSRNDWGNIPPEDARLNDAAVANEGDPELRSRLLSSYKTRDGETIWIITEHDRSVTTLLLPEEY
jgi:hypothetical protein